jgi:hypothetical protein
MCLYVCPGDAITDCMMAEFFEYDWTHRHISLASVSSTKTESLNGVQDKTHLIQAVQNLIPTRPEIGEFQNMLMFE